MNSGTSRRRVRVSSLLGPLLVTLASMAIAAEGAVRFIGQRDLDGNLIVFGQRVPPARLPVEGIRAAVQAFETSAQAVVVEDPALGWAPRPGSRNDLFTFNDIGVRVASADHVYSPAPAPGTLRLQVYGDSFALGDEVSHTESWAHRLEQRLGEAGMSGEVMNFGANGYGIDQAFLRWRASGVRYAPHVVVLGLQTENVRRNVNLIRPLYNPFIDLPFSKPRFIEVDGHLALINSPPIRAADLAERVRRLDEWPLVAHEAYFDPNAFQHRFWQRSAALAVAAHYLSPAPENREADRQFALAMAILGAFEDSVRAAGGRFLILYVPRRRDLEDLERARETADAEFVEAVSRRFPVAQPAADLLQAAGAGGVRTLFRPGGHYTPAGNELLAKAVARELQGSKVPGF